MAREAHSDTSIGDNAPLNNQDRQVLEALLRRVRRALRQTTVQRSPGPKKTTPPNP